MDNSSINSTVTGIKCFAISMTTWELSLDNSLGVNQKTERSQHLKWAGWSLGEMAAATFRQSLKIILYEFSMAALIHYLNLEA